MTHPKILSNLLICALTLALSSHVLAQKDKDVVTPQRNSTELSDPPPSGFSPVAISKAESDEEAEANERSAGFRSVYFSNDAISTLTGTKDAVGVRFYNAMEDPSTGKVSIVAVAVKSDGTEINPFAKKAYYVSQEYASAKAVSKSNARTCVENCSSNSELTSYTAFFSNSTLNSLLAESSANGVVLQPGSRKFTLKDSSVSSYKSMTINSARLEGTTVTELGSDYKKSLEPCPYFCPDDKYLLTPAKY